MDLGDLVGARDQLERALEIMREALGPDHRRVAKLERNLAAVIRQMLHGGPSIR
jgi:uncharacterized protein (DUF2267 family)